MENYVLALGIRGYSAWDQEWTKKTRIMEEEEPVICGQYKAVSYTHLDVPCALRVRSAQDDGADRGGFLKGWE